MPEDWPLYEKLCQDPLVCNANAYLRAIRGESRTVGIDSDCRKDLASNGVCWCGKLTARIDGRDGDG